VCPLVERIVLCADGAERFWVHAGRQVWGVSDLLKGAPGKLRVILDYSDHVHADQCDRDIGLGLAIYFEAAFAVALEEIDSGGRSKDVACIFAGRNDAPCGL
jgi:hypothetical protein